MKSIHQLNEKEFNEIKDNLHSYYPLIYWKINNNINKIEFENKKEYHELFQQLNDVETIAIFLKNYILNHTNTIDQFGTIFSYDYYMQNINIKKNTDFFKDLIKIYILANYRLKDEKFLIYNNTKKFVYDIDIPYGIVDYPTIRLIGNRHDGFFQNYMGPLKDTQGLDYCESIKNKIQYKNIKFNKNVIDKKPISNDIMYDKYLQFFCSYTYRLIEHGKIKEAKKVCKKLIRKIKISSFYNFFHFAPINLSFLDKILFTIKTHKYINIRRLTNFYMSLYRLNKGSFLFKYYLKKTYKLNNYSVILKSEKRYMEYRTGRTLNGGIRPQHLLKMIEIYIDYYHYVKKDKKVLAKILFLYNDVLNKIVNNYYSEKDFGLNYNIISELTFISCYYYEKILNIDIKDMK